LRVTDLADSVLRVLEDAQAGAEELLFEPTVRLGVTGLSRAGKTVFITSLVANLMNRGRMLRLSAAAEGRIEAVELRPQPDRQTPRFDYESHLGSLLGPTPRWPASTRQVSQLRLSLRVRPTGLLAGLRGPRIVHLDIVDYPGEWLLDLPLLSQSYAEWSAAALEAAGKPARAPYAASWLAALGAADPDAEFDETTARTLAEAYRAYLAACRAAGLSALSPGRFLMPGDLAGSPALTFAPLPPGQRGARRSLATEMARRYDAYVEAVVKPFFRNHFARLDRQVVLVDVLSAIDSGPQAVSDLREEMTSLLSAFRHGANDWLSSILGRRVDRILFAATKADHIHHSQHPRLAALLQEMLRQSAERAAFRGADVQALALASLRATTEQTVMRGGRPLDCVRGLPEGRDKPIALHPGDLPSDPKAFLEDARRGAEGWLDGDYGVMNFAPPAISLAPGDGPPHIRLDAAAEFLIGDKLT
jgi:predicted YcjX-like family ATPase